MHLAIRISLILMFFLSLAAKAQKGFDAGLFLGLNGDNFTGEPHLMKRVFNAQSNDAFIKIAFNAGVFVSHRLKGNFSWRIEVKYNLRGLSSYYYYQESYYQFMVPYSISFHCLEVPLIINYSIPLSKRTHNFYAGFVPSRIASAVFYDSYLKTNSKEKKIQEG